MREPLFTPGNAFLKGMIIDGQPETLRSARESAALHRATNLAIESAFSYGIDFPVGAVALQGGDIVGRGFANDTRLGQSVIHAEIMAMLDTRFDVMGAKPDTLVVTCEPCVQCQDGLSAYHSLKRVVFGLSRAEISAMGLVKPKDEDIFMRADRLDLPYEVAQSQDEQLKEVGLTIFNFVSRQPDSGEVSVDCQGLSAALRRLNEA